MSSCSLVNTLIVAYSLHTQSLSFPYESRYRAIITAI